MSLKKLLAVAILLSASTMVNAQMLDTTIAVTSPKFKPVPVTSGDHFVLQIANNVWTGLPDSIDNRTKSFNRSANVYVMLNKPFRTNEKLAIGFGIGVGTSSMFFKKTFVGINANLPILPFINADSINHF